MLALATLFASKRHLAAVVVAVAVLVACAPVKQHAPKCGETPTGGETIGTRRYLEPVFADVTVVCDLQYGQAPDERGQNQVLTLDLYRPAGDTATNRPVVLWLQHGGFIRSIKAEAPVPEYATRLAQRGYVVAAADYRVREGDTYSYAPPFSTEMLEAAADAQHDAQAAVRWLRAHAAKYDIDPNRVAVAGISAGGMTALMVNYDEGDVGDSGNLGFASDVAAAVSLEGCALDLAVIDGGEGPALLIHSIDDSGVPYHCARDTVDAALAAGDWAELDTRAGFDHGFTLDPAQALHQITEFLYDHVSGPSTAG